jgi:hypothetical protein
MGKIGRLEGFSPKTKNKGHSNTVLFIEVASRHSDTKYAEAVARRLVKRLLKKEWITTPRIKVT